MDRRSDEERGDQGADHDAGVTAVGAAAAQRMLEYYVNRMPIGPSIVGSIVGQIAR